MNLTTFALLLQDAPTPPAGEAGSPSFFQQILGGPFVPLLLVFVVIYFIILRPEQKSRKARQAMIDSLKKGDSVLTTGGLYGSVVQIQDQIVTLQVADGVRMRFSRAAISTVEPSDKETADAKAS